MSSRGLRSLLLLVVPLLAVACGDDSDGSRPPGTTPPTVREVQPTGGPVAGNTLINVYGSGFQEGAKLYLGEHEAQRVVVVNAFRMYGYTPAATSAYVDVRVVNPDGAYGVLVKGFAFEGPPTPNVDQAEVINGNRETVSNGQPVGELVEGSITVAGITRGAGQGGGVRAQVGFAPGDSDVLSQDSYTWEAAKYVRDSDSGEGDIYQGTVLLQPPIGGENREWVIAIRFSIDGGRTWVMADGDGVANGLSASLMRRVFISRPRVDYCKLGPDNNRSGLNLFYQPGTTELHTVVGQVFAASITQGSGAGAGLTAQLGYGPEDSDPRESTEWTWINATYKGEIGSNDEWQAQLPNPGNEGRYRIAMRFSISENTWRVCDVDGVNDSTEGELTFNPAKLGVLTVDDEPPAPTKPQVDWCKLGGNDTAPEDISYLTTQTLGLKEVIAQVNMAGVTDKTGAGAKLVAELGYGPRGTDPRTAPQGTWIWTPMAYSRDPYPANDEWKGTLPNPRNLGNFSYAVRFSHDGGPVRVCDGNGHNDEEANPFELEQLGKLTVTGEPVATIGWCKLGGESSAPPPNEVYRVGQAAKEIYAQVYMEGVTPGPGAGTGIQGQVGYGPVNADPTASNSGWQWTSTGVSFNRESGGSGNDDEWKAALPNPGAGNYKFAFRFNVNGGAYRYCDADGLDNGFSLAQAGNLEVRPVTVDSCHLLSPLTPMTTTPGGTTPVVRGKVLVTSVTDTTSGSPGARVSAQVGYGPEGSTPSDSWTWTDATFSGEEDNGAQDAFQAALTAPMTEGRYSVAIRFRYDNGAPVNCDRDGSGNDYQPAQDARLQVAAVVPPTVDWCRLGGQTQAAPPSVTYTLGGQPTQTIYVQVHEAGVTPGAGAGTGIIAELGYGPAGVSQTDEEAWTWVEAAHNADTGNNDQGVPQNDEFGATLPVPAEAGSYRFAYRVRVGEGPNVYCDADSSENDFNLEEQAGTLTVQDPASAFCRLQSVNGGRTVTAVGSGDAVTVVGRVHIPGVTNGDGAGADLQMQVGLGAANENASTNPTAFSWKTATYSREAADEASTDEFTASLNPAYTGSRTLSMRYTVNGGESWTYCDQDGGDYSLGQQYALTVNNHASGIGYCNLQWPFSLAPTGGDRTVYGRVYAAGVTPGDGAGAGLVAHLGYGSSAQDPGVNGWTWITAPFLSDEDNKSNDQFSVALPDLPEGTSYLYRYSLNGGAYCFADRTDRDASNNGLQGDDMGKVVAP